jgi:hypothetical protein
MVRLRWQPLLSWGAVMRVDRPTSRPRTENPMLSAGYFYSTRASKGAFVSGLHSLTVPFAACLVASQSGV